MRPTFPTRIPVLAAALLAASAAGAQTVSLQRAGEATTILVGEAATLPADFPADVHVPAGATLVRVDRTGQRLRLEFTSPQSPQALATVCAAAMADAGWAPANVEALPGAHVLAWEKDTRAVLLAVGAEGAGSRARLQLLERARRDAEPPAR